MPKRRQKLTRQDQRDLVYLAGQALNGILADHQHVNQLPGNNCAESCAEWSTRLAFETLLRLKSKAKNFNKGVPDFYGIESYDRLYPPQR